jgi:hypothetical protein
MPQEEQEEAKPKKLFVVTHIIWDDTEIDTEMYEFRKNPSGRGAPGKWRLGAKDFKRRIEETLGDADQIGEILEEHLALTTEEEPTVGIKPIRPPKGHVPDPKELAELEAGSETPVDEPLVDPDAPEADNMDFGEFGEGK